MLQVNGVNIEALRHSEVVAFIKSGGNETHLLVVDQATDEHFKKLGITPTGSHIKGKGMRFPTEVPRQVHMHVSLSRQGPQKAENKS